MSDFQIHALADTAFSYLFELSAEELAETGAISFIASNKPGFPCRISLEDAEIGEELILLNYLHHQADSPYKASGAIFIRRSVSTAVLKLNELPAMLRSRLLSLRGYDSSGLMVLAIVTPGDALKAEICSLFETSSINYIQIHNAREGCFLCAATRA